MVSARRVPDPAIGAAVEMLGLTPLELWTGYFALGGLLSHADMVSYLDGITAVSDADHDMFALVLNEQFADRGQNHPIEYYGRPPTSR